MKEIDRGAFFDVNLTVSEGGYFNPRSSVEWSTSCHRAAMCKFYYITEGRCEITIEGEKYTATAGDWFFIPARTEHSYHNFDGEPFTKYWMHFEITPT